jgi:hypothetical protein
MVTVFLARDLRHTRQLALKVLKPELAAAVGRDRFLAETWRRSLRDQPRRRFARRQDAHR